MDAPNNSNDTREQQAPSINNLAPIINNPTALMKSAAAQQQASTSSRKRPPSKQLTNPPQQRRRSRMSIDAELITDANQNQQQCTYQTCSLQRHKSDECNIGGDCNHCRDEAATGIINLARGGVFNNNNTAYNGSGSSKLPPIQPQQQVQPQRPPSVVNSHYNPQASLLAAAAAAVSLPPTSAIPPNLHSHSPAITANVNIQPLIGTASIGTNVQQQQQQQNNTYHNSIVQLTITKCKPSYIEPWNKLPMERVVGTGVIIPWTETPPSMGTLTASGSNNGASVNGGNSKQGIRILTTASLINHATSILGQNTSVSPLLAKCTVDYISLSLDLALLKVDIDQNGVNDNNNSDGNGVNDSIGGWDCIQLNVISNLIGYGYGNLSGMNGMGGISLPRLGEEVMIVGYTATSGTSNSSSSVAGMQQQHNRGTISGYHANEDDLHILRMKINLHTTNNNGVGEGNGGRNCGSGVVVNTNGQIVGITSSSSSLTSQDGFTSGIPACVIGNFLNQCNVRQQQQHSTASSPRTTTSSKRKTNSTGDGHKGINYLPGIPNLGITGYQTLENKALQQSLGLEPNLGIGVRILGINHTVHPSGTNTNTNDQVVGSNQCNEDKKCHTSMLRTDDVLLAVDDEPVQCDGTVRLTPSRPNERVDFRWLISQRPIGSKVKLDVIRQRKKIQLHATLSASKHLVPKIHEVENEEDIIPSYVICGGCVFVPLTEAWLLESQNKGRISDVQVFQRYLQELRKGDQQIIILSHVLADSCNIGYHSFQNMILTSVNGQRPITNMNMLMDVLVKKNSGSSIEFRLSNVHIDRAKVVICMNANEMMESETRILSNYGIESWCSGVSSSLRLEAEGKAHRHGAPCCLKTMRALRNSVRQTTLVVPKQQSSSSKKNVSSTTAENSNANDVSVTRRIIEFGETHKMQSAPLFAGKYTEEGGWTQVKTKHLSQLCACGKSTRFYCICSIGVMRCKDCFLAHCKDHSGHTCTEACGPNCNESGADVIADGVELVTTHKRKRNNPAQAIQSRCVVCKAKTCYCCSGCGFEKEVALCHVSTGRNCLHVHATSEHSKKSKTEQLLPLNDIG